MRNLLVGLSNSQSQLGTLTSTEVTWSEAHICVAWLANLGMGPGLKQHFFVMSPQQRQSGVAANAMHSITYLLFSYLLSWTSREIWPREERQQRLEGTRIPPSHVICEAL